jgi:hypothetical protein
MQDYNWRSKYCLNGYRTQKVSMLSFEVMTIFILLRMTTFWLFIIRGFFLVLDLVNFSQNQPSKFIHDQAGQ